MKKAERVISHKLYKSFFQLFRIVLERKVTFATAVLE